MDQKSLTVSVPEAATLLGISRSAAYAAARTGELPAIRFGTSVRVPRVAIDRMIESASQPTATRVAAESS